MTPKLKHKSSLPSNADQPFVHVCARQGVYKETKSCTDMDCWYCQYVYHMQQKLGQLTKHYL